LYAEVVGRKRNVTVMWASGGKSSQSELWKDKKDGVGMNQWECVPRMAVLRVNSGECRGGLM